MTSQSFTQHHHWGTIEHGVNAIVYTAQISDEYLWEFLQPEEFLENIFGSTAINDWLAQGGGFEITDEPNPLPRFHKITVRAYHPDPRQLTLISLKTL